MLRRGILIEKGQKISKVTDGANKPQHCRNKTQIGTNDTREPHLSSAMQHRCRMDAVVSRTSSEVRTRQKVSP